MKKLLSIAILGLLVTGLALADTMNTDSSPAFQRAGMALSSRNLILHSLCQIGSGNCCNCAMLPRTEPQAADGAVHYETRPWSSY